MAPTERYQIQLSSNPTIRASSSAGIATTRMRMNEATSGGIVLPIAWNMLPFTKMMPDATRLHDTMRRYSAPTAIT